MRHVSVLKACSTHVSPSHITIPATRGRGCCVVQITVTEMQRALWLLWFGLGVVGCLGWFTTKDENTLPSLQDCDGISYTSEMKICCSGQLFIRYNNDACCGGLPHDSDNTGCCSCVQYSLSRHICCQDTIAPRLSRDACCGALPYDSGKADCRQGEIYVRYPRKYHDRDSNN
ncbi:hypothetical protein LSAT2_007674 [Lamellibrachia satsuma]|nr:hypothetical protein LSAT2_007674 [Lamellibrachia satsuma]